MAPEEHGKGPITHIDYTTSSQATFSFPTSFSSSAFPYNAGNTPPIVLIEAKGDSMARALGLSRSGRGQRRAVSMYTQYTRRGHCGEPALGLRVCEAQNGLTLCNRRQPRSTV